MSGEAMKEIFEFCELCGAPLDADNCYGEADFPLCRYHHEMFGKALGFLVEQSQTGRSKQQLSFFDNQVDGGKIF